MLSRKKVKVFKNRSRWPLTVLAGVGVSRYTGTKQHSSSRRGLSGSLFSRSDILFASLKARLRPDSGLPLAVKPPEVRGELLHATPTVDELDIRRSLGQTTNLPHCKYKLSLMSVCPSSFLVL